jgi:hypothetical protein
MTTLRITMWELDENFKPNENRITQLEKTSTFVFPANGTNAQKDAFCKNEIKDYQLLEALYFKIDVFANSTDSRPFLLLRILGQKKALERILYAKA